MDGILRNLDEIEEIFDCAEVVASPAQMSEIYLSIKHNLDMERELHDNSIPYRKPDKCQKCESKDGEIKRLKEEIGAYRDSVKKRRNATEVWIEDGDVRYL